MKRIPCTPRPDWIGRCEEMGFSFHTTEEGIYWDESACYEFTAEQIDVIDDCTAELYDMCMLAVDRVMKENLLSRLSIPERFHNHVRQSWKRKDQSIYGRFDLAYSGTGHPKMLEFNADTPTALYEASIVQWVWLEDTRKGMDQFNSIHEKLVEAFQSIALAPNPPTAFHFASVKDNPEDFVTTEYLRDVASQQGIRTKQVYIEDIGWSDEAHKFADMDSEPIDMLFKLYPWEWMMDEEFGRNILLDTIRIFEPPWKMVLSNKGILPILWEMFRGHPNLLPASETPAAMTSYVSKPILSREGANITIHEGNRTECSNGTYAGQKMIYQQYEPLPVFDGNHPVVGSWIVNGKTAGIGIREDSGRITTNTSRFVPHYFKP